MAGIYLLFAMLFTWKFSVAQPDVSFVNSMRRVQTAVGGRSMEQGAWSLEAVAANIVSENGSSWPYFVTKNDAAGSNMSQCAVSMHLWISGLLDRRQWAIKMADAGGKLPTGVLQGNLVWLGSFKECLNVTIDSPMPPHFHGSYCSVTIGNKSNFNQNSFSGMGGALRLDLCVPSTCSNTDVASFINSVIPSKDIEVLLSWCRDSTDLPLSTRAMAVICLLCMFGAVIVAGTLYDVCLRFKLCPLSLGHNTSNSDQQAAHIINNASCHSQADHRELSTDEDRAAHMVSDGEQETSSQHVHVHTEDTTALISDVPNDRVRVTWRSCCSQCKDYWLQFLLSFSILRNSSKLLTVNSKSQAGHVLEAIHGIRFLSMSWVILGHTWVFPMAVTSNVLDLVDVIKSFSFQAIMNATVSVDTFFVLSGTLMSYLLLSEMKRREGASKISWIKLIVHRYWRLTPVYMMALAISTSLFVYWGSGPLWPYAAPDPCPKYWWTNLLYVNNFLKSENVCFGHSWYLANDMQFFLLSLIFVVILYKNVIIGVISVMLTITASCTAVGVISYKHSYPAETPDMMNHPDTNISTWFDDVYWRPWCRIGPYLVGVLLGYLLFRLGCKARLHWALVILFWCLATACNMSIVYGLYDAVNGHPIDRYVAAIYAGIHRTLWGVGVAWVIFACVTGYGGIVNTILSWEGFVPLSRLSYAAYLVHPTVILMLLYNQQVLVHATVWSMTTMFCGYLVLSYIVAFVVSMVFEAPMIGIMKLFLHE